MKISREEFRARFGSRYLVSNNNVIWEVTGPQYIQQDFYFNGDDAGLIEAKHHAFEQRIDNRFNAIKRNKRFLEYFTTKVSIWKAKITRNKKFLDGIEIIKNEITKLEQENREDTVDNVQVMYLPETLEIKADV